MKIAFFDTGIHNTFLYTNLIENGYDVVKINLNSVNTLNNVKVDFVYPTFADTQLSWITQYNINNNLISIKQKTADLIQTKDLYYKIFNSLNIPCPKVYEVIKCDKNLLYNIPKDIIYPCIVKPFDGTGGCDVYIASNHNDLILFLSKTFLFQRKYYNRSVILQESVYPSKHNDKLTDIVNHLKKFISHIELNNYPFMLDVMVSSCWIVLYINKTLKWIQLDQYHLELNQQIKH